MKRKLFAAVLVLVFAASVNGAVVVTDHAWDGVSADNAFYNSLTNVATGNGPAGSYDRFSLDLGDSDWQTFTLDSAITVDSLYIGYNDQGNTGEITLLLDSGNDGTDYTFTGIALSGLQTDGDNSGPVHWLQFDLSAENVMLSAGINKYTIVCTLEEGSDNFVIAPLRSTSDTYAGGTNRYTGAGGVLNDALFAVTGSAVVPEPATMAILGLGALLIRRKR